jgi:hypothetical protein
MPDPSIFFSFIIGWFFLNTTTIDNRALLIHIFTFHAHVRSSLTLTLHLKKKKKYFLYSADCSCWRRKRKRRILIFVFNRYIYFAFCCIWNYFQKKTWNLPDKKEKKNDDRCCEYWQHRQFNLERSNWTNIETYLSYNWFTTKTRCCVSIWLNSAFFVVKVL